MAAFLGLDIGTSSAKAVVLDEKGRQLALAQSEYTFLSPLPLWAQQNPGVWWEASSTVIRKVLETVPASSIAGVGLSGQMHGLVAMGKNGECLDDSIIWCDRRSRKEVDEIYRVVGKDRIASICHSPVGTGFLLPSLLWLRSNKSDIYNNIYKVILPKDYVRYMLTDTIGTDYSDAAGSLALDVDKGCWSEEILGSLGLPLSIFPPLGRTCDIAGCVTAEAASSTGLREGTPVIFGGADQVMQAIGNGIIAPGPVSVTIGTGGQVLSVVEKPVLDKKMVSHCFNFTSEKSWFFLGASLSAGYSLNWIKHILGNLDTYGEIDRMAEKIEIGSERLIFLPYLSGDRTPHMNSNARGVFFGLSNNHTRANLYRAVMEGVTFSLRECIDVYSSLSSSNPSQIIASGGATNSNFWLQMQADVFKAEVIVSSVKEQAATGASLAAATGVGFFPSLEDAASRIHIDSERKFRPIEENVESYNRFFEIYKNLYKDLESEMENLSSLK